MSEPPAIEPGQVTQLLARLESGDRDVLDRLFPLVYEQLRRSAELALRSERPGHTLVPTALVNEVYLKLVGAPATIASRDRAHFMGIAARAMRQILVDYARRRGAAKRGGGVNLVTLEDNQGASLESFEDLVALGDALERLGEVSTRLRSVVEMRFFAGLTEDEIAEALGVTARTVKRDWVKARAWLYREIYPSAPVEADA